MSEDVKGEVERLTKALEHCRSQAGPDSCAALALEGENLRAKLARVLAHCQKYRTPANEPGRQAMACEVIRIIDGA